MRFDKSVETFEKRMSETVSDYKDRFSDVKFSDGPYLGKAVTKSEAERANASEELILSSDGTRLGGFKNHSFNRYEHYLSGYETQSEIPKGKLA